MDMDKFSINKLLKPVMNDDVVYNEVKWKGYNETTIEPRKVLLKDVPKMVNQFEKRTRLHLLKTQTKKIGEKTQRFHILK
jgi:hypothetical protein